MKLSFYNAIALLTFTACSNDYPIGNEAGEELDMPVFTASLKDNYSRAHLTSAFSIYWNEDDRISVFAKSTDNTEYRLSDGANSRSATFHAVETKSLGATSLPLNGAVYPYDANNKIKSVAQGYEFSFNIPFEQIYTPESFDRSAFPMVAISENTSLQFRNVCGMLMLQLSGKRKIASITLKGKENEVCAGSGKSILSDKGVLSWTPSDEGTTTTAHLLADRSSSTIPNKCITLTCSNNGGVQLKENPTSFVITVAPVTFSKGFEVVLTDMEGRKKVLEKHSAQTLASNQLLRMPVVNCEFSQASLKAGSEFVWDLPENAIVGFKRGLNNIDSRHNYPLVSTSGSEHPAYLIKDGNVCTISTSADDILLDADCSKMFQQASNLKAISFAQCNTQRVENMNSMFKGCKQLTKLDMGNIDTRNVQAAAGFASLFEEMGSAVPEGCDLVLGEHFIIHTPENASGMFSNTNIRSITCTPELQQFLLKHANIIGLKTITAAGPISWYNLYTGQLMNTTNELVITHELNHFVIPQLEGTITNARIMWGDNQEETYQKNANHTYSSVGEHHVTVQSQGADGVSVTSIKGIKKINFSKF